MKNLYKNILKVSLGLLTLFLINSCDDEETSFALNNISAPSDLVANIVISADDANTLSVTPAATGASVFQIYFGDVENEEATIISLGETAEHTYEDGEYLLRVIAQGITGLTSEFNSIVSVGEEMVITPVDPIDPVDPNSELNLPIDYESTELVFDVSGFGSATAAVIDNPDTDGNSSTKVLEIVKPSGAEVWAGSALALDGAIDFSSSTVISILVWSPRVGTPILFKIEDSSSPLDGNNNPTVFVEVEALSTVASTWEELTFDMSTQAGFDVNIAYDTIIVFPDFGTEGAGETFYFDNIMITEDSGTGSGGATSVEPDSAPPVPTQAEVDVISLFSNAYTDVTVDTWRTDWSDAAFEDVTLADNPVKKYSELNFVGIETTANQIDVTNMTHLHIDVWSADFTEFKVKLVDFGADGAFDAGDIDDVEHELTFETPVQGEWISLDIPLSDFEGLTTRANIAQYIFVGAPSGTTTVFIDNLYFYSGDSTSTEPNSAPPIPTQAEADVISLFSDSYTDVIVDTWRTDWSSTSFEDVTLAGNPVKEYSDLDFVGIETVANQIDATNMTHLHIDVWSADFTEFKVKLVDFGADGAFDAGDIDDVEHELTFETPVQGEWISLDIPLSDFEGLTTRANIAQYIFASSPSGNVTVFIDNLFFY